MRIGVDAMGGDFAPKSPVLGTLQYLHEFGSDNTIVLIGDEEKIKSSLSESHINYPTNSVEIVHTSETIEMTDSPAKAIREKKNSSMVVGLNLHKEHKLDAFISAGNTGAQMAASLLILGRIPGVNRPSIGSFLPSDSGVVLLLDVGANTDCKPINLAQFGLMGGIYLDHLYSVKDPTIGLLSIGEEATKGNELTRNAYALMVETVPNFIGNVEGRDIMRNKSNVVVCDGFTGNILLKFAEAVLGVITRGFKSHIGKNLFSNMGALLVKPAFRQLKLSYDYQEYGGVPLLGVNGISIICHGSSSSKAIKNAIRVAETMSIKKVNVHIKEQMSRFIEKGNIN